MSRSASLVAFVFLALVSVSPAAAGGASCGEWVSTGSHWPGIDGPVYAVVAFEDSAGPCVVLGGEFTMAGSVLALNVVRFDGTTFSPLGPGLDNIVHALHVHDDGSGPALYAGGEFDFSGNAPVRGVARWNGDRWRPLGSGVGIAESLTTFDDGTGPVLVVAGRFRTAGGVPASRIATWDGQSFSRLGNGLGGEYSHVWALAAFDDGKGPGLYATGTFYRAGRLPAHQIAKWDGLEWSTLGSGLEGFSPGVVRGNALAVHDDGNGLALFVGGMFLTAGGVEAPHIARWDGEAWSAVGSGTNDDVAALHVDDLGEGPVLLVGGRFSIAGGAPIGGFVKWDGASFSAVAPGNPAFVGSLASAPFPSGRRLVCVGSFPPIDGVPADNVAVFDGASFSRASEGGFDAAVGAIAAFDGVVYVDGGFTRLPGGVAAGSARLDGEAWIAGLGGEPGGGTLDSAQRFVVLDDGGGPGLFATGTLRSPIGETSFGVARWTGSSWDRVGSAFDLPPAALAIFDDGGGPALVAGGGFGVVGSVPAVGVARFDGLDWQPMGSGVGPRVRSLATFDDGSGPALFATGDISAAGGFPAAGMARWDGFAWSSPGDLLYATFEGQGESLAVFDDGSGPALYVGGSFTTAGGVGAFYVARFDGAAWSDVGGGVDRVVRRLEAVRFGDRSMLVAGAAFNTAGGTPVRLLASWDGARWSGLGSGLVTPIGELTVDELHFDASGSLYVGGPIESAGRVVSRHFARFSLLASPLRDGNVDVARTGVPAPILAVNGSAGATGCGRVIVASGTPVTVSIAKPPAGGAGHYVVWALDGAPPPGASVPIRLDLETGVIDLGLGCRALPTDNLVVPGTCPQPLAFMRGRASMSLGPAEAAALFVRPGVASPRAPASFSFAFPAGVFTICGVASDPGSASPGRISIANWVVVESM